MTEAEWRKRERFIPAHAGNTACIAPGLFCKAVHPRPRGEHSGCKSGLTRIVGSSPPTRGTHPVCPAGSEEGRFIPAHAGNTAAPRRASRRPAVHPRPRGEHRSSSSRALASRGSSPPTRGTRDVPSCVNPSHRFIPAHAGNTRDGKTYKEAQTVHPRPRGEHIARLRGQSTTSGSSPPTRGTPCCSRLRTSRWRFIPAHAGNTPFRP